MRKCAGWLRNFCNGERQRGAAHWRCAAMPVLQALLAWRKAPPLRCLTDLNPEYGKWLPMARPAIRRNYASIAAVNLSRSAMPKKAAVALSSRTRQVRSPCSTPAPRADTATPQCVSKMPVLHKWKRRALIMACRSISKPKHDARATATADRARSQPAPTVKFPAKPLH